jgi:hypothetical protein
MLTEVRRCSQPTELAITKQWEGIGMPRQIRILSPSRYLTDDEIVEIAMHEECCAFRLRIWRDATSPAIVLASQLPGGPSPSWASSRLANLAYQVHLGFSVERMINFEDETVCGERVLFAVAFTFVGYGLRRYLTHAVRRPSRWSELELMVGAAIDRWPGTSSSPGILAREGWMVRRAQNRRAQDRPAETRLRIWGSRACLVIGVIAYLGLSAISIRWRPNEPFIASIWIFFAAHTAAYLLLKEVRGHDDDKVSW